jgi:hypothetical protein
MEGDMSRSLGNVAIGCGTASQTTTKISKSHLDVLMSYVCHGRQTDRPTDRQTDRQTRVDIILLYEYTILQEMIQHPPWVYWLAMYWYAVFLYDFFALLAAPRMSCAIYLSGCLLVYHLATQFDDLEDHERPLILKFNMRFNEIRVSRPWRFPLYSSVYDSV